VCSSTGATHIALPFDTQARPLGLKGSIRSFDQCLITQDGGGIHTLVLIEIQQASGVLNKTSLSPHAAIWQSNLGRSRPGH